MQTGGDTRVLAHVADNVRRFRHASELSQASLADRAGLSRRTVVKLESGEANISLTGLCDLADALGVTFVDLVAAPAAPRTDIREVVWRGDRRGSVATLLASVPASRESELWSWVLAPGDRYDAEPDPVGWFELLFVVEGELTVELESGATLLRSGEHHAYSAAQRYSYVNAGDRIVRFTRVVSG